MLPHNHNNNGNYSERESTRSKFKRAFAFIRKPGAAQDDPGFQSDYAPQAYSQVSNAVPTSSNAVTSTAPTRRPNPKMALQVASSTIQAWGRKPKHPAHPTPALPPPRSPPNAHVHPHPHAHDHQRPRPSAKTPQPLRLPIQLRRTSQLLPGPDISAALEYIMDPGAHDDKRKSSNQTPPQQPISQPSSQPIPIPTPAPTPTPTYPPLPSPTPSTSPSATPLLTSSSATHTHTHSGTIEHPTPHSPHFPTQSPSSPVPRRASISSDSHPTPAQQLKRRSASLGTLDIPLILTISSSDPSPSNPSQPPSSYHAPPSKTIYIPPAQSAQASTRLETSSPPLSPPYLSGPSNKPTMAASTKHAQSFQAEIQNMQPGSLNTRVGLGIRGKLAGWTGGETPSSSLSSQREHSRTRSAGGLIGQFAPAATSAAKRAYEKVNNLWSGGHNNTSQTSVGRGEGGSMTDREGSNKPWHNRTPNGPSGNWSGSGDERAARPGSSGRNDAGYASDAIGNGMGSGPRLGTMLRSPFRRVAPGSGGVVFARPLADCVRDTKPLVVLGNDRADIGIEERFIPALVLRCVQHLERWGVQEEGLFRISGRASHIARLRNEFASGADYDLTSCGPGDLDPHAVASVLKAFLRELPDPILTRNVAPAFEAVLEKAKASGAMNPPLMPAVVQGPGVGPRVGARLGLPTGPRQNSMPLSRFFGNDVHIVPGTQPVEVTAPSSTTPVKPPNSLLREFNRLVQKLPRENRDLLQTIVELLARTAVHAKTTKMPLSNLLLVFCPSVSINPSVFKIMVENHEPIFNQALLPPPSPTPSEHPSEDSIVYEDINLANTTSQPTPSTDYHHPRTPPQLPRIEPSALQLEQKPPLLLLHPTGTPSEAAPPSELVYPHSPAVSPEPETRMKAPSPRPLPLVSGPQTTSHGVPPSVSPSLTPSSSTPSSMSELNTTVPNRGPLPKPPRRIPVPYGLQPAASQSSLQSHSSAVSIPSAKPSPSITSLPAQQDLPAATQGISDAHSALPTHPLRLQTSFDKPLPNPFSPAAPEKAGAPSPVSSPSPSLPSPAPEEDQNSGDDADSEAKPGRHQYTRVVSMAPALPELENLPPMTASFTGSTPPPPFPPPPMPSLPPLLTLGPLNLNPKSMFTSTIAPLKIKGHRNEPTKVRGGTSSSTASSLGSSISRQLSPAIRPSVKKPASVKDDASDEKLVEVSETLPLRSQLTPLMKDMEEENMIRVESVQEKTSGPELSSPPKESRPSSAEPPTCVKSRPVPPSPPIAESSKMTLDTFVFDPRTQPLPEIPIKAAPLNTTALAPSMVDPTPEDVANPKDEIRAPSNVECESPSKRELVPTEITATETQGHAPLQELDPRTSLGINEVVDVVERQSTSYSSPTDPPPQQEEDLDAATLAGPHVVAPPRLAPPDEGRLLDDWVASVLKAATASP